MHDHFSAFIHTMVMPVNDNTILAQQMVAAAPAATRGVRCSHKYVDSEGFVAILNTPHSVSVVAQVILGQKDIRDCVPYLINRTNVI
ncbi:hypothetical protein LRS06_06660 [Hymenobacter sp. J193]|uniref:hypothetical protein n=1 Tax=Hymenobacter sp. J193 TaxID=2898429 RepID=UPI00215157A9|nr:hypothetical protein [Hymenobacter sp. J193]MCR5887467.1 hypothetical protein [Hymenobacter sp. J193]